MIHFTKDERLGQDLAYVIGAAPRPSTPFVDRSLPQTLIQRRLQSRPFFSELLERINRMASAIKGEIRTSNIYFGGKKLKKRAGKSVELGPVETSTLMILELTRRFSVYNLDRLTLEEFDSKGQKKEDKAVAATRNELLQKTNKSRAKFEKILGNEQ
jgi:hypothetical protein